MTRLCIIWPYLIFGLCAIIGPPSVFLIFNHAFPDPTGITPWGFAASEMIPILKGDVLAKLLHLSMGIATISALYGFILPRWGRMTALLAALFYFAVPAVTMNAWTSGNDVGTGLFQTLGILSLLYWHQAQMQSALGK